MGGGRRAEVFVQWQIYGVRRFFIASSAVFLFSAATHKTDTEARSFPVDLFNLLFSLKCGVWKIADKR